MGLSAHLEEPVLQEFEDFARSHTGRGDFMDVTSLRDHAEEVRKTIVRDLEQPQSSAAEVRKSKGEERNRKTDHGVDDEQQRSQGRRRHWGQDVE